MTLKDRVCDTATVNLIDLLDVRLSVIVTKIDTLGISYVTVRMTEFDIERLPRLV